MIELSIALANIEDIIASNKNLPQFSTALPVHHFLGVSELH
jgi:hypothetical protein